VDQPNEVKVSVGKSERLNKKSRYGNKSKSILKPSTKIIITEKESTIDRGTGTDPMALDKMLQISLGTIKKIQEDPNSKN